MILYYVFLLNYWFHDFVLKKQPKNIGCRYVYKVKMTGQ